VNPADLPAPDLQQLSEQLQQDYQALKQSGLALDLTRGKPAADQLQLSNRLLSTELDPFTTDGTDLRNYGGLQGIQEVRNLGANLLGLSASEVIAGGNSSLSLMYQSVLFAWLFGVPGGKGPWQDSTCRFLCPCPGYDRHYSICEELGIEMLPVSMLDSGPDMNQVEQLIDEDSTGSIMGIWCVPKYSNPTGVVYSEDTVRRIAGLASRAAPGFRVFWDNAYVVHDLDDNPPTLANLMSAARELDTASSIFQFASTSKITFAGAGVSWLGATEENLSWFCKHLGITTIGHDKVNQARLVSMLPDMAAVRKHMGHHAELLKPKFNLVQDILASELGQDNHWGKWTTPKGGYFISFDTAPGLASRVVELAAEAGVKLTPAGATFPYRQDPEDRNIRLAPSFPPLEDVANATKAFSLCVKLATVEKLLNKSS
jgi:aspartate/methionine/tyrosine aminotransferase